ncbi:MAG: membrane protein insertase YidC [Candidatus Pelagibacterales bacterium]|jgi:YidC/Oxa1 family membrane protein insertase|nr:MAG: membrane protein insertase YidC [Pelagibacterales bacterium]
MESRNLILAIILSVGVLFIWSFFFEAPEQEMLNGEIESGDVSEVNSNELDMEAIDEIERSLGITENDNIGLDEALSADKRVKIETNSIVGSINLKGLRIDDIVLKKYNETQEEFSEKIRVLQPIDTYDGYEVTFGWIKNQDANFETPNAESIWKVSNNNATLTSNNEVEFEWSNTTGQTFVTTIGLDEDYLFDITQEVKNNSNEEIIINNASKVTRKQAPSLSGMFILHEGLLGVLQEKLELIDYDDLKDDEETLNFESDNGWVGITDKYWLAALIPDQNKSFKAIYTYDNGYIAYYRSLNATKVAAGSDHIVESQIFIGAKEAKLIDRYQEDYGIYNFDLAIDWGWFYFLTKPLFNVIYFFSELSGNFGLAIIILTVITRIVFFPLANWSFISMAKMKMLQPEMTRIKELHKDDRAQQQQALMALYKKEKVNPISGCLPILIQIPFFFAIYKMLFVSIEMRHAPFYGWIQDLAAKDPTTIFNLFGLIPWDPPSFMIIGIWPVLMGLTMYIQQKLNPAPPDPIQARIFMFFPLFITILLAQFAAGLVIYWTTNNVLSIIQQWIINKRTTVKTN